MFPFKNEIGNYHTALFTQIDGLVEKITNINIPFLKNKEKYLKNDR